VIGYITIARHGSSVRGLDRGALVVEPEHLAVRALR
jgi:hypothetical protein